MSEQIKTDFARAQKFIKAGQYAQAITILQPHKEHPRIAALIADLEAKRKPKVGGIGMIAIWVTVVIIVAVIAGAAGYGVGVRQTRMEYEIPQTFEDTFVDSCTANTDVSAFDCAEYIRTKWLYYQSDVLDCYNLIQDVADLTEGQFLGCIADVGE